jgi:hypothetical protein
VSAGTGRNAASSTHGTPPPRDRNAGHGADQRQQDEGPQPADALHALALALLALHADQGADQERGGEVQGETDIEGPGHIR